MTAENRMIEALTAWRIKYYKPHQSVTEGDIQFMSRYTKRPTRGHLTQESKDRIVWQKGVV